MIHHSKTLNMWRDLKSDWLPLAALLLISVPATLTAQRRERTVDRHRELVIRLAPKRTETGGEAPLSVLT